MLAAIGETFLVPGDGEKQREIAAEDAELVTGVIVSARPAL